MNIETLIYVVVGAPVVVSSIVLTSLLVGRAVKAMGLDSLTSSKTYEKVSGDK